MASVEKINRSAEYAMRMTANKTKEIGDETKEILIGVIIDDFENKKEIFIPNKEIAGKGAENE